MSAAVHRRGHPGRIVKRGSEPADERAPANARTTGAEQWNWTCERSDGRPHAAIRVTRTSRAQGAHEHETKNTICLWFDKDAHEAGALLRRHLPDSEVTAVHEAPGDYPGGKERDVLTVEFTVLGIPCLGLNGGPEFRHSEAFSFQIATDNQEETDRY